MIRKTSGKNEWKVFSESKGDDGKRKLLGTYKSKSAAEKRLAQVERFKKEDEPYVTTRPKRGR